VTQVYSACDPSITIERYSGITRKNRTITKVIGVCPDSSAGCTNTDIDTTASAIYGRVLHYKDGNIIKEPIKVDTDVFNRITNKFKLEMKSLSRRMARLPRSSIPKMFSCARKRALYEKACTSLVDKSIAHKDSFVQAFPKYEVVPNVNKVARAIQTRTYRYHLELATYLKRIEHVVYNNIQRVFKSDTPVVMKGVNHNQMGEIIYNKWSSFNRPVAIGIDAHRFDMHVTEEFLKLEHDIYKSFFPSDNNLYNLLLWQLKTYGKAYMYDGHMKYHMKGRRLSGDMNTSLGNCIIMCCVVYSYLKDQNIKFDFVNNGDDGVIFIEKRDLSCMDGFIDHCSLLGFRMAIEAPVEVIEELEFCQTKPVLINGKYAMIRNLSAILNKGYSFAKKFVNEKEFRKHLYQLGVGGLSMFAGVPVHQEVYELLVKNGLPHTLDKQKIQTTLPYTLRENLDSLKYSTFVPSLETRISYFKAFGLWPHQQLEVTKLILEMRPIEFKYANDNKTNCACAIDFLVNSNNPA
jgi:hypothetical protein